MHKYNLWEDRAESAMHTCFSPELIRTHLLTNFFDRSFRYLTIMPPPPVNFNSMAVSAIEYTLERAEEDQSIMKTLFNKLLQSDVDPEFMQNYCVSPMRVDAIVS